MARFLLLPLLLLLPLWVAGQGDPRELDLQADYPPTLRWDNVEDDWPWLDGVAPGYRRTPGWHVFHLQAGQQTHLQLPARAWLRLLSPGGEDASITALEVMVANGSGLYVRQVLQRHAPGDWLLAPGRDEVLDVLLRNPAGASRPTDLVLFVSRWVRPPLLAPYRHPLRFEAPALRLRLRGQLATETVWSLRRGQALDTEVTGPARYRIETRLDYRQAGVAPLQDYRLKLRLDARPLRTLALDSAPEVRHVVLLDGQPLPAGQLQQDFIDIPAGRHHLSLSSSAPLLLRLLRSAQPDYLLPDLNQPRGLRAWRPRPAVAGWELKRDELEHLLVAGDGIEAIEAAARGVAGDNRHGDGGLLAAMALGALARAHPEHPVLAALARKTLLRNTYYQDLMPDRAVEGMPLEFFSRRLREPRDQRDHYIADPRQLVARRGGHQQGYFVTLKSAGDLKYALPPRHTPSLLRIAVAGATAEAQGLSLILDDGTPHRLSLRLPEQDRRRLRLDAAQAWAGLHPGARAVEAGVWEFPLPSTVRRIRIQRTATQGPPLRLALQYRRARPWRMADADYLQAMHGPSAGRLFQDALLGIDDLLDSGGEVLSRLAAASGVERQQAWALLNHWTPLLRWLRRQRDQYAASIGAGDFQAPARPLPEADQRRLRDRARADVAAGQWLSALETWRLLVNSADRKRAREARLGMAVALLHQGEPGLAERLLRSSFLHASDETLREAAQARLRAFYTEQGDAAGLAGLTITALLRGPNPRDLARLPRILRDNGLLDMALDMALLSPGQTPERRRGGAPARSQDDELKLELALAGRRWVVFEACLRHLPAARAELWRGYRAQAEGELEVARGHWDRAGAAGRALIGVLEQGRRIAAAGPFPPRSPWLTAWARWLQALPGSHVWRRAPEMVRGHAGLARIHSPSLDLQMNLYRVDAQQPLRLHVNGPVRLRFDIRPVHDAAEAEGVPLQGWVRLRDAEEEWVAPISNNLPNPDLQWPAGAGLRAGRRVQAEVRLGPGPHDLRMDGGGMGLLVQVYAEQPLLPLAVLPEGLPRRPPALVAAGVTAAVGCLPVAGTRLRECRYAAGGDGSAAAAPRVQDRDAATEPPSTAAAARPASRPAPLPPLVRLGTREGGASSREDRGWRTYRRMVVLLWDLERRDADTEAYMDRLLALSGQGPLRVLEQRLLARALRYSGWSLIAYVPESAGVRYVRRPARPASPSLRARLALMGGSCAGDRLLSGDDELVYAMFNTRPVTLRLQLRRCEPAYVRPGDLRVELDDGSGAAPRSLYLKGARDRLTQELRVPAGNRRIRLRLVDPVVNQYLALRIIDPGQGGEAGFNEQAFQVARRGEPVRFDIRGPAWLRIDELRDGRLHSQYLPVAAGWRRVVLKPAPGQRESLYRIWRRVPRQVSAPARLRSSQVLMHAVPGPLFRLADAAPGGEAVLPRNDDYPLGGQEDGSLSLAVVLNSRTRVDDEAGASGSLRENFTEFRAEYRYFDPLRRRYWRGEARVRGREFGGPTLGLGGHVYMTPWADRPWLHTSAHLSALVQHPGDSLPGADGRSEWIVNGSLRVLAHQALGPRAWHEPALTLFGRLMSLQRNTRYPGKALDRDVFSRYKAQHQRGLRLADTLTWRPWRDTEWFLRAGLSSNEDFNPFRPDNVSGRIGWRQLFGPVDVEARLRVQRFLADSDRRKVSTRRDLDLQMNWMDWPWMQRRLALGLRFSHNLNRADNSFLLTLSWQGGNGRGYRDFRHGEIPFYELRRRDVPERGNRPSGQGARP